MRTIDGIEITDGLLVWDYDLEAVRVSLKEPHQDPGQSNWWFDVIRPSDGRRKLMSNDRLWFYHPTTRRRPQV